MEIPDLRGPVLVVMAHPDDESGAAGGLLQRISAAAVAFLTDGAPADPYFWKRFGSRAAYAEVRRNEATCALGIAGVTRVHFLADSDPALADQELHRALDPAVDALDELVARHPPAWLLTSAYEGGHPDHDACSFVAHVVGRRRGLPVWEVPLYYRTAQGTLACRQFLQPLGGEVCIDLSAWESQTKRAMLATYASQRDLDVYAEEPREWLRPQPAYDYPLPPHPGPLNYEFWGWPISGAEVCAAFARYLATHAHAPGLPPQEDVAAVSGASPGHDAATAR